MSGNLAVESILKFTAFSKFKAEKKLIGKCKMWLDLKVIKHLQLPEPIGGRCIRTRTGTL